MLQSFQLRKMTTDAAADTMMIKPQEHVRTVTMTRGMHVPEHVARAHTHTLSESQCGSMIVQEVPHAPVEAVWEIVSRFESPQEYKRFVKSCHVVQGDGRHVGSVREIRVVSGMPAESSTERLEVMDEERHVIGFGIVGGDHRLNNYRSVTTLHESPEGKEGTVVMESYVVDVPAGNTREETCSFVDTIVRCNLQSLAHLAENITANNHLKKPV